jgi:hypothetical protein
LAGAFALALTSTLVWLVVRSGILGIDGLRSARSVARRLSRRVEDARANASVGDFDDPVEEEVEDETPSDSWTSSELDPPFADAYDDMHDMHGLNDMHDMMDEFVANDGK